jgi:hypothetical protein
MGCRDVNPSQTSEPDGYEPLYSRSEFDAVLSGLGEHNVIRREFNVRADGVWVTDLHLSEGLSWHPQCEVVGPGSPNPADLPLLPFPFAARELAAMMVDGWGSHIQLHYGDWDDGPDQVQLQSLGILDSLAADALAAAYAAYRDAAAKAPKLKPELEEQATLLGRQLEDARRSAISSERLREPGITDAEYAERLARVHSSTD